MTTPVPFNAGQAPARPTYTHRTWLDEMAEALCHVAGIFRDFEVMAGTLREVSAGRTQMQLVEECRATALHLMNTGVGFVQATDDRYLPVFEAIKAAGGVQEVAQDKRYHDRG